MESFYTFLSTLSLRRATIGLVFLWWGVRISIHALLAESDLWVLRKVPILGIFLSTLSLRRATCSKLRGDNGKIISIHALLAESDKINKILDFATRRFLSTLSLRRATYTDSETCPLVPYFYPRSPCGERLTGFFPTLEGHKISIHALLAESD